MKRVSWAGSQEIRCCGSRGSEFDGQRKRAYSTFVLLLSLLSIRSFDSDSHCTVQTGSRLLPVLAKHLQPNRALTKRSSCNCTIPDSHLEATASRRVYFEGVEKMLDVVQEVLHFEVGNEVCLKAFLNGIQDGGTSA